MSDRNRTLALHCRLLGIASWLWHYAFPWPPLPPLWSIQLLCTVSQSQQSFVRIINRNRQCKVFRWVSNWVPTRVKKCAEAKIQQQLLVSNFSWRRERGICLQHMIDVHKNQRHSAKRFTSLRKQCHQNQKDIHDRTALDSQPQTTTTLICALWLPPTLR